MRTAPGIPEAAADDEHPAVRALVRLARPGRQCCRDVGFIDAAHDRREFGQRGGHHAQIVEPHHASVFWTSAQVQAGFETDKTYRELRAHRLLSHRTAVGIDSRRNVQRQHGTTRAIDGTDHRQRLGACRRPEPGA